MKLWSVSPVVVYFDCHSEQAFFATRGIWAICAKRRVLCDAIIARLDRFPNKVHHLSDKQCFADGV